MKYDQITAQKIALISPSFFGYEVSIKNELLNLGYNVFHYDDRPANNIFHKVLIRLKATFLIYPKVTRHQRYLVNEILSNDVDAVFLLNPELFSANMIKALKKDKPNIKIVLYIWDSLQNRPNLRALIEFTDYAYTFDRADSKSHPALNFFPLFYNAIFEKSTALNRKYNLSFIGSYHSNRAALFKLIRKEPSLYIHIYIQGFLIKLIRSFPLLFNPRSLILFWHHTTYNILSKEQVSQVFKESHAVIDLQHPRQSGLTCRTIEALASGCILITSNSDIRNYEFFDDKVIYVMKDLDDIPLNFIGGICPQNLKTMQDKISHLRLDRWLNHVLLKHL